MYDFSGKKAIVTGASGFLGSHLSLSLSQFGAEVHGVSRSARIDQVSSIKWWKGNVTEIDFVRKLFVAIQPDFVFHLCSHSVGSPDLKNLLPTVHNDFITTINVLTVATEQKTEKLILASSLEEPKPSDPKIIPSTPYAAAKWAGSAYAQMFHLLYQTPVVLVRPYMTYGPRQPKHKVLPYVILSLLRGEAPKLASGNRPVDWIFVDDVTNGILCAAEAHGIEGETIDLGSGNLVPIQEIVQKIVQLIGCHIEPLFGAFPDRPQESIRVADVKTAFEKLNWRPTIGLDEGLRKTIDWYREHRNIDQYPSLS